MSQSTKKDQVVNISKSTGIIIMIAALISSFALTLSYVLFVRFAYQNKVLSQKREVNSILSENVKSVNKIKEDFKAFDGASSSVLGTKDANSKIVLDALPSKYDFPALITSIENISTGKPYIIQSISGSDEELTVAQEPSGSPQPVVILLSVAVRGNYDSIGMFVKDLERSIRPIKLTSISLSGNGSLVDATVQFETYFQPGKNFEVTKEVIR